MGSVCVIKAGVYSVVQDLGRTGHGASGVPVSGAFDAVSLRVGNRLLGNDEHAAAIEMALRGGWFRFDSAGLVCLSGARIHEAVIVNRRGERPIDRWRPTLIAQGDELRLGEIIGGARSYLCVSGGVLTDRVLGSRSVLASCGLGGGPLREDDRLAIGCPPPGLQVRPLDTHLAWALDSIITRRTLRIVESTHCGLFSDDGLRSLARQRFTVSAQSNREGIRCLGGRVGVPDASRLVSEGVVAGCVQIPPGGEPIVLGVDGPTTGGYPVPACVISADLSALGQCRAGDEIRFSWVDRAEAMDALRAQERVVHSVPAAEVSGRFEGRCDDA